MMPTTHTGSSQLSDLMDSESEPRLSTLDENCISSNSPIYTCTVPVDQLSQASFIQSQKFSLNLGPINHSTYPSHPHGSQSSFSRSTTFCTTLHVSSPSSSDTNRQLGLPFLPFLSSPRPTCADKSSNSFIVREASDECSPLNPEINFLEIEERSSDGRFEDFGYSKGSLALTEELEVGYMSDELKIAINASEEVPRIDEIYGEWCLPAQPSISLACDGTGYTPSEQTKDMNHPRSSLEAINKSRMKWTSELHELFLDAVNKLDGFDKATPKNILLHMNIKGLNIYHVKSHLQKYRLTKKMQDLKQDEASSHIKGKESSSISKNGDTKEKRRMLVTETLRMQLEFQKQLHEQLKVQNELQLRIERHGEYLRQIMEEQKKAAKTLDIHNQPVSLSNGASSTEEEEAKDDCSSPEPKKKKAADCTETGTSKRQKLILNNDEETS